MKVYAMTKWTNKHIRKGGRREIAKEGETERSAGC